VWVVAEELGAGAKIEFGSRGQSARPTVSRFYGEYTCWRSFPRYASYFVSCQVRDQNTDLEAELAFRKSSHPLRLTFGLC
jgi:hypothetical protein